MAHTTTRVDATPPVLTLDADAPPFIAPRPWPPARLARLDKEHKMRADAEKEAAKFAVVKKVVNELFEAHHKDMVARFRSLVDVHGSHIEKIESRLNSCEGHFDGQDLAMRLVEEKINLNYKLISMRVQELERKVPELETSLELCHTAQMDIMDDMDDVDESDPCVSDSDDREFLD